nr:protein kinase [Actinoplanes sp. TFC3]
MEPASDVYALGVMLYRQLAGESPWSVETTTQMLTAHVYVDPVPLRQLPGVPDTVTALVNRCLRKEPEERPSAGHVSQALLSPPPPAVAAVAAVPATSVAPAEPGVRWRKIVLAGVAVAAVAGGALMLADRGSDPSEATMLPGAPSSGPTPFPVRRPRRFLLRQPLDRRRPRG